MQRIYDSATELEAFQDGDVLNKIPGTRITKDWLNAVQEELAGVVEGTGAALDPEDNTQLKTAIEAMAATDPVILSEQASDPSAQANKNIIFAKNIDGYTELFSLTTHGSVQLTERGLLKPAPPLIIPLPDWQTDPSAYKVEIQDIANTDGHGADLFYKYVFKGLQSSIMYTKVPVPFEGYDLRLVVPYRMSTSFSGGVVWWLNYKAVSADEGFAEMPNYAAFDAVDDEYKSYVHTPNANANYLRTIDSDSFKIPATAYSTDDEIYISLQRYGGHPSDTHTGNAEASSIFLKLVAP